MNNIFVPRLNNLTKDNISDWLHSLARFIFIATFSLLPIFFIPNIGVSLGFIKTYFVVIGVSLVLILFSLAILRRSVVEFSAPAPLLFFGLFILLSLISGLLSGDHLDSLFGNNLDIQSVAFFSVMGLIMISGLIFGSSKLAIAKLFIFSAISSIFILLVQVIRLFVGPDFLSLGLFTSNTSSVIGSFNDLALFAGLLLVIALIFIQGISLGLVGKISVFFTVLSSLIILVVVNFSLVWMIIGGFSLLMLLYVLSKDTWLKPENEERSVTSKFSLFFILFVVLISAIFIVGGDNLGSVVSKISGINYLEVRPSTSATFDIAKAVYSEDVLLGVGPNRFEDAWRQYKDPVINQTDFWSTDFTAGNSFLSTVFITTGLAGGVALVLFLLTFVYIAYRTLIVTKLDDGWHLVGVLTFVPALYLWLLAVLYVPGSFIMMMTALLTGLSLAVYTYNNLGKNLKLNVLDNRQYGFVLILLVLTVIVSTVSFAFNVSKQYLAQKAYADSLQALANNKSLAEVDALLQDAEQLYQQDTYTAERAKLRLVELNRLLGLPEPTPADEQTFQSVLVEGIALSEKAINLDSTNPFNYALMSSFYGLLDPSQSSEIKDRRDNALMKAKQYDPVNPSYNVLSAQFSIGHGDFVSARDSLNEAVRLKNNYTDALFMLSQIEISEGNVDSAIKVTASIISIEPNNPTRYFQLGVLLATAKKTDDAVNAFKEAIRLDPNYANARYFLALSYLDLGKKDEALQELRYIEESNKDNQQLKDLISKVESGEIFRPEAGFAVPVNDGNVVDKQEGVTTSSEVPNTDLIEPLNQVNSENTSNSNEETVKTETATE